MGQSSATAEIAANKALITSFFADVFTEDGHRAVAGYIHQRWTNHGVSQDRSSFEGFVAAWMRTYPHQKFTVDDLLAEDDKVVARVSWRAVHDRPARGVPPTGREITGQHIHIFQIAKGKIAAHWANRDDIGELEQLGFRIVAPVVEADG